MQRRGRTNSFWGVCRDDEKHKSAWVSDVLAGWGNVLVMLGCHTGPQVSLHEKCDDNDTKQLLCVLNLCCKEDRPASLTRTRVDPAVMI